MAPGLPGDGQVRVLQPARQAAPAEAPLQPLASALAAGTAYFADSPITRVCPNDRAARRLTAKAGAIFAAFPAVTVGAQGIWHERGGLTFVELDMAGSSYLVGCGKAAARPLSPAAPAEVVTGMCLFGVDSVLGRAGGQAYALTVGAGADLWDQSCPLDRITVDQRWHVYEAETLVRLVPFMRDLARQFQAPVRIFAHIPGPEYQLYGLALYAMGLMSARLLAQYRAAVARRARLLAAAFKQCLDGAAEVTPSSPLRLINGLDVANVPRSGVLGLVYDAVRHHDGLWRDLLAGEEPSFKTIIYASFRYAYLAAARRAAERGHQVAFCENPDEAKIHQQALSECGRTGVSLDDMAGFYVHPMVVATQAIGGMGRLLRECANGCEPATVAAAMGCYVGASAQPGSHSLADPWRLLSRQPSGPLRPGMPAGPLLELAGLRPRPKPSHERPAPRSGACLRAVGYLPFAGSPSLASWSRRRASHSRAV